MALQSLAYPETAPAVARRSAKIFALPRPKPKILFATVDSAVALPRVLRAVCDIRTILPGDAGVLAATPALDIVAQLPGRAEIPPCAIAAATAADGLPLLIVLCPQLYARDGGAFADAQGRAHADNDLRFARLSLAVAEIAARGIGGWTPDAVHLNDWPTALAAGYMSWAGVATPTVLTLNDLASLGEFPAERLGALAIPPGAFVLDGVEFHGRLSFLKAGLVHAGRVATPSAGFAREIAEPGRGGGLEGLFAKLAGEGRLGGGLDGVDDAWDPRADRNCPYLFDPQRWKGRYADFVRGRFGLSLARAPLFAFLGGLDPQHGVDLVVASAQNLIAQGGQLVAVGEGAEALADLARRWPEAVGLDTSSDAGTARAVCAGADFMLLPSRVAPCGLAAMRAQKFGALPIALRTGALAEAVTDGRTGLLFEAAEATALDEATARAFALYKNPRDLSVMRRAAMARDAGWGDATARYLDLYRAGAAAAP